MVPQITPVELDNLRQMIEKLCGIAIGPEKAYLIETRLANHLPELGCSTFSDLYQKMSDPRAHDLRDRIVDELTTNETLWFRDNHPFRIFREVLLPLWRNEMREHNRQRVRIWCAACSTGQEPYSLAMQILEAQREIMGMAPSFFEILATDISSSALNIARLGQYDSLVMNRGMQPEFLKYFQKDGRIMKIEDRVKGMVRFQKHNLIDDFNPFGRFDLILCRNVAIYFSAEFKRHLFEKFAKALYPGGFFMLGASESLSSFSQAFQMLEHQRGIYYRKI